MTDDSTPAGSGLSRRGLLGLAGAGVVGVGIGLAADRIIENATSVSSGAAPSYPFYGDHQAGIITPAQDRLHFAAFDVLDISVADLQELLADWSYAPIA